MKGFQFLLENENMSLNFGTKQCFTNKKPNNKYLVNCRKSYHGAFIDCVQAHDSDMKKYFRRIVWKKLKKGADEYYEQS